MSADHGQFSGIKGVTQAKMARNIERTIDKALAEIAAEKRAQHLADKQARKAARIAEAERPKLTRADCEGAKYVRDQFGWHAVVRVNAKSVTVKTPYSWTETIPFAKVLEARYPHTNPDGADECRDHADEWAADVADNSDVRWER